MTHPIIRITITIGLFCVYASTGCKSHYPFITTPENSVKPTSRITYNGTMQITIQATDDITEQDIVIQVNPDNLDTIDNIIDMIKSNFPEVEKIEPYLTPQPFGGDLVIFIDRGSQKDFVFKHGEGDCAVGCLSNYYWYYSVYPDGKIKRVGHFERIYDSSKGYIEIGTPFWGYPK